MSENKLLSLPYAQWLEQTLQQLVNFPVKGICLIATTENGEVYNNYFQMSMLDKLTVAGVIQQDATFDALAANGVIEYAEDEEKEENDDQAI